MLQGGSRVGTGVYMTSQHESQAFDIKTSVNMSRHEQCISSLAAQ